MTQEFTQTQLEQAAKLKRQAQAQFEMLQALAEAIRELGSVPSGHLYASLCGSIDLAFYNNLLHVLTNTGLVKLGSNHILTWTGPAKES